MMKKKSGTRMPANPPSPVYASNNRTRLALSATVSMTPTMRRASTRVDSQRFNCDAAMIPMPLMPKKIPYRSGGT